MRFSILDDGNRVAPFDTKAEATAALAHLAEDPEEADRLLPAAFDEAGEAVAVCVPGESLVIPA